MTMQSSGEVSFTDAYTEFGIDTPALNIRDTLNGLASLYEVPTAVPGQPAMSDLYGITKTVPVYSQTISFTDNGTAFVSGDLNTVINAPKDYRLREVYQTKNANGYERYLRIAITRPTGSSNTHYVRRVKIAGITDVSSSDGVTFDTRWQAASSFGGVCVFHGWDYYWVESYQVSTQIVAGTNYAVTIWADTFN